MPQTTSLLDTLKQCLKAEGKTYADVATALDLSEASVKRMFATQNFSLQRLDMICAMLGIEISDVVQKMQEQQPWLDGLTHQQEYEITQDIILVLVTVCVFNGWTMEQITSFFTITQEDCLARLLKLYALNIIQLLPNNRIKLLVSSNFQWQENGPFERFFKDHIGQEYFDSNFEGDMQSLTVLNGTFSRRSAAEFQRKLQRLGREFIDLTREDAVLPFEEREGVTLVMALRNWDYGLFRHLIRG